MTVTTVKALEYDNEADKLARIIANLDLLNIMMKGECGSTDWCCTNVSLCALVVQYSLYDILWNWKGRFKMEI